MIKWNNKCQIKWTVPSTPRQKQVQLQVKAASLVHTRRPVISNRAGDITLPRKSPLILPPRRLPLFCCITTWPLHMQMQTKPPLPVSLRHPLPPHRHTCVSLSCCLCYSQCCSHTLPPRGHGAQTGTEPDLLCHTGLAKHSLSLSTLQIPHTSFHQSACGPLLLLPLSLFSTTAEINTLKVCPPTSHRKIRLPLLLPGTNKALTHLNAWLLCNHTEGKTKSSINNVTSRHRIRYQVSGVRCIVQEYERAL